jgi:hypothetical protein
MWQGACMCLVWESFEGINKKDGEVSLDHQNKEDARHKENFCRSLIDGPNSGWGVRYVSLLCGIVFHVLLVGGGCWLRGIVVLSSRSGS